MKIKNIEVKFVYIKRGIVKYMTWTFRYYNLSGLQKQLRKFCRKNNLCLAHELEVN